MKSGILKLLALHLWGSYLGMFVAMIIEGPCVTAFGGFVARVGVFNLWLVFLFSILGNFIPDVVFYAIGFWGRITFIDRYGGRLGISRARMQLVEKLYKDHPVMTLLVVKLVPFLPPTGLAAAGAVRMPLGKYSFWSLLIILVTSGLFLATGYFFGEAYVRVVRYQEYALTAIGVSIVAIAYGYNKLTGWLGKRLAPAELR